MQNAKTAADRLIGRGLPDTHDAVRNAARHAPSGTQYLAGECDDISPPVNV